MWVLLEGFPPYAINIQGEIQNTKTGRLLKPRKVSGGRYLGVALQNNGTRKEVKIHQLLGIYFLPKPQFDSAEIDHINRNGLDNRIENLRWVTRQENTRNRSSSKLTLKQITEIKSIYELTNSITHQALANMYNVSRSLISSILNSK
jgi:hypothetical protein